MNRAPDIFNLDTGEVTTLPARYAFVHPASVCADDDNPCVIHSPSDHHMRDWPMILRETNLIERACIHGIGHPDPDSAAYMNRDTGQNAWGVHGCDWCCRPPTEQEQP